MNKILYNIFLFLGMLSFTFCSQKTERIGFTFYVPDDFDLIERTNVKGVYESKEGHGFAYTVIDQNINLQKFAPLYISGVSKWSSDFQLEEDRGLFVHNEREFYSFDCSYTYEGEKLYHYIFICSFDHKVVTLFFSCSIDQADEFKEVVQEVIESIEFADN